MSAAEQAAGAHCVTCGDPIHREELVVGDPQSVDWVHDTAETEMDHPAWPRREVKGSPKPADFDEMAAAAEKGDDQTFIALAGRYRRDELDDWSPMWNPRRWTRGD